MPTSSRQNSCSTRYPLVDFVQGEFFFRIFWLIAVFKIKIIQFSVLRGLLNRPIFLCIESTIWRPQELAKTIKLHSYDVENCEDTLVTMVDKGEIKRKGRTYCMAGALYDSYKSNTHIPGISRHCFPKDVDVKSGEDNRLITSCF